MVKFKYLILGFFFTLCLQSFGQSNFKKGFLIDLKGDTIRGFVKPKTNENSERQCQFKFSEMDSIHVYKPTDIAGFGFDNDRFYESKNISQLFGSKMGSSLKVFTSTGYIFLEVLVKGNLSLYRYRSEFIFEKGNQLQLITNNSKADPLVDKKQSLLRRNIRLISTFVSDCNLTIINHSSFRISEKPLTKIARAYNECVGEEYKVFKEGIPETISEFSVSFGFNFSKPVFFGLVDNPRFDFQADFKYKTIPLFGVEHHLKFPRISDKYSMVSGLQFLSSSTQESRIKNGSGVPLNEKISIKSATIRIPIALRHTWESTTKTSYINIGFVLIFDFVGEVQRKPLNGNPLGITEPFVMKSNQQGLWVGYGFNVPLRKKVLKLELRLERTNGIVGDNPEGIGATQFNLKSKITNLQFLTSLIL